MVGLATIVVLIGTIGGLAFASVAGARRTESSFPTYLHSTNPSTMQVFSTYDDPGLGVNTGYDPALQKKIAQLPLVKRLTSSIIFDANINLSGVKGIRPRVLPGETPPTVYGSFDGEYSDVDRMSLVSGELANPKSVDQAVMNVQAAKELGVRIGSVIQIPFYTDAQVRLAESGSGPGKPSRIVKVKMVGEIILANNIVESDFDALGAPAVIFSPALTRLLAPRFATGTISFLQVRGGDQNANRVYSEIVHVDPNANSFGGDEVTSSFVPAVQQAIGPEALALAVFGGIAGLAVLLIVSLIIGRTLRVSSEETNTLRALGADRHTLRADQLTGVLGAVFVGGLLAVAVAIGLSPLSPLGPVRPVYPTPGVSFDWIVFGFGFLILVTLTGALALFAANRELRRITMPSVSRTPKRESWLVRSSANSGLPISAVTGVRFALDSGKGRTATPVRSAILGVTVLIATLTFGASLDGLVSRPQLYGWNWNFAILAGFAGAEDLPAHQTASFLSQDRDIASWSGAYVVGANLDGNSEGMVTEQPGARVQPPILSGHGLRQRNQVVLGSTTLAQLHKHVGDTVTFSNGDSKPSTLLIVGTATMPAIEDGIGMGSGALVASSDFPTKLLNLQDAPIPGPNVILVRTRAGVSAPAAYRSLVKVNREINAVPNDGGLAGGVVNVLRPVEIVNFHAMGTAPTIFAACLGVGAIAALGITLGASVRRRRRDLALLKALGFTRRQLAAAISWQATVAALFGAVVGIPLGIVIGRELWELFARSIDAVPDASIPSMSILFVSIGTVAFANLVAAIPGRIAARTSTALVLRTE
jgi:hypothetical protein